ncbi:hypothetical protein EJ05DRAFT_499906 [Pseudovirgaria hyperparasitica]|uniref:Deacetylase complex subunit Sds3 n=1 Tax=Pseudovirgaria hyperparasitica TaxID=470096 RepID=A0A6A6W676_9PEZI|nr:uncharacterized protein EJ05DRAFT_499906 [Pseudovirgaria hyperparasitica]KAF2758382.1 hypothetical protein EJ05DRAFT_499906 [Pseudovirgaria hyperparasitica]
MARVQSLSPQASDYQGRPNSPQHISKRDKRRNMLSEKLVDMVTSFADNRDAHYRAQATALQADLSLILKADPYSNKPLEDNGYDVAEVAANVTGGQSTAAPSPHGDFAAQVGRYYSKFVDQVNDSLEERDVGLTLLHKKYENQLNDIEKLHEYRTKLAVEEHKALKGTLRERLIQQLNQKRSRLLREKEQLDIADSNAQLLHPNQFTTAHSSSPGGPQGPRKTRNTRQRVGGDTEDVAATATDNRRKRKAATYEEENDSPGPSGRNVDIGTGSPFRDAKAKTVYTQFEAPVYSIDRLFTEKELSLSRNHAEHATINFFRKPKVPDSRENEAVTNGVNGDHADDESHTAMLETDQDDDGNAQDMIRTGSYHATRGAARNALGDYDSLTERLFRIPSSGPVFLTASFSNMINKPNATAPPPPALLPGDVDADLALMTRDIDPGNPLLEKVLQHSVRPLRTREYQYPVRPGDINEGPMPIPNHLYGGEPMSAQTSLGGLSDVGPSALRGGSRRANHLEVTSYTPERFLSRQ